jgi:Flp pilus assembly protein TadB
MATKKQRRRREKELRHEYEYVYIDEEGKEVEVEQPPPSRKEKQRQAAVSSNGRRPTQVRPVQPPDWRFLRKQALIFFAVILVVFSIVNKSVPKAAALAAVYTLVTLPVMWLVQRAVYRSYLKRTGQLPPPRDGRSK